MKTKAQKSEELKKGKQLLEGSHFLVFTDFTKVATKDLRRLRSELTKLNAGFMVIKKRLLAILLKEKGVDFNPKQFKFSLGTVFAQDIEKASATVYKFFKELGAEKEKVLGGLDLKSKGFLDADKIRAIGQLPPREVLLGQLLGMIVAPIRSLLYVLKEKSTRSTSSGLS
ncbi:MAG: 50S ribosomal protein L10 [Patescibacteria group bacterium]